MENNNLNEPTLLSNSIYFETPELNEQNDASFLVKIEQEFITKYAKLDESLQHIKIFYMFVEDYCYNIVIPAKNGHKLFISKSQVSSQMASIYSLNYQEIMIVKNEKVKIKKR